MNLDRLSGPSEIAVTDDVCDRAVFVENCGDSLRITDR
jgi:hypothetical protein